MKDNLVYIVFVVVVTAVSWTAASFFSDSISDYEVIKPVVGVECVVVSRMFNTSVDCWEIEYNNLQNTAD